MELDSREYPGFFGSSADRSNSFLETAMDVSGSLLPLWVAVLLGLVMGWLWKPRWVSLLFLGVRSRPRLAFTLPPGLGFRRFWFALTASITAFQMLKECWLKFRAWRWPKAQYDHSTTTLRVTALEGVHTTPTKANFARSAVGDDDLRDLYRQFHYKDGGAPWELMMERSIPGMTYEAWRRDPEGGGPTQYRSRTVFENATPELVKDFYWDDEFRHNWDDMILYTKSLEGCTETGAEIVHWIRKFPFFCSNREYIIGRRIYKAGGIFFCITKGVPYSALPAQKKPRRVNVYFSSWCIRPVGSPQTGQMTACEVTFLHSEDMGIQRDIAKLGVRQGMWNCVRRMEPGLRKYQAHCKATNKLSHSASMAQLVTHVPMSFFGDSDAVSNEMLSKDDSQHQQSAKAWKWMIVGGAVVLACGLDKGVVGKVLVFGLARRLSNLGKKL